MDVDIEFLLAHANTFSWLSGNCRLLSEWKEGRRNVRSCVHGQQWCVHRL